MTLLLNLLEDGIFAAIAAIGFASISNPPVKSLGVCAILAAIGHATRYALMNTAIGANIIPASFAGAIVIGLLSIPVSRWVKCPAESFSFPALLPMIPGMYAYRTVQALLRCIENNDETHFMHYFYLLNYNWIVCVLIIALMVVGVTIPIFMFSKTSFKVTK